LISDKGRFSTMQDRLYSDLRWFPLLDERPAARHWKEGLGAVRLAHRQELTQIAGHLRRQQSVLVVGDKGLAPYLEQCLMSHEDLPRDGWDPGVTVNRPNDPQAPGRGWVGQLTQRLAERLAAALNAQPRPVVILRHLDLMTWTAGDQPRPELNEAFSG
jgi:hypothetical protein